MLLRPFGAVLALAATVFADAAHDNHVTSSHGELTFYIRSNNIATNGRQVQLRKNQNELDPAYGYNPTSFQYTGLDDHSPKLQAKLKRGYLKSTVPGIVTYGGYLSLDKIYHDAGNTRKASFGFANTTIYLDSTDPHWYIDGHNPRHTILYHDLPSNSSAASFALCKADYNLDAGPWHALTYFTWSGTPAKVKDCEFVQLEAKYSL